MNDLGPVPHLRDESAGSQGPAGAGRPGGVAPPGPAAPSAQPQAAAPKACQACDRIIIRERYVAASKRRVFAGLFFVYTPIVFLPLFMLSGLMVHIHLRMMGARNLKTLRDFMPERKSHRYSYKTQITRDDSPAIAFWNRARAFWIFNCTFYCPTSVAVLEWHTYLVKAVENWWCPFHHERKPHYAGSALDASYWHLSRDVAKLDPQDRDNPIWNPGTPPGRG